ncbi:hypothetical protein SADUNF_Sadunf04G0126700 [Salix dunnii]|uniref:Uncharacterized protein n=1 Tax=Salix dunnii TaxID=1413687 RepID=A0A835KES5_9ROSI|nr:hypothetical protein SADUNF_Sadunf04G0126700 [Salix dunnii]
MKNTPAWIAFMGPLCDLQTGRITHGLDSRLRAAWLFQTVERKALSMDEQTSESRCSCSLRRFVR